MLCRDGETNAFQLFDRVTVLYEGKQIFFGRIHEAKAYFENLGFECKWNSWIWHNGS